MISNFLLGERPSECAPVTDICSRTTVIIMAVLALINIAVIVQGVLSCKTRIAGYPLKMWEIVLFYVLGFLSLGTGVLYCFSWLIIKKQACGYYFVESLPAFIYLLSAYAYMTQSISSLMLQCEMLRDCEERQKQLRRTKLCNKFYYFIIAVLILAFFTMIGI